MSVTVGFLYACKIGTCNSCQEEHSTLVNHTGECATCFEEHANVIECSNCFKDMCFQVDDGETPEGLVCFDCVRNMQQLKRKKKKKGN